MMRILRSPRLRRRLAYAVATPLVLAGAVTAGVLLLPEAKEDPPEVFGRQQAINIAAGEKTVRLTRADRKQVNETIDMLINAGVKRRNPAAVYRFASPGKV